MKRETIRVQCTDEKGRVRIVRVQACSPMDAIRTAIAAQIGKEKRKPAR